MGQVIKFTNRRNESVEFSINKPCMLKEIEGLSGVGATEVTYKGFKQDGEEYQSSTLEPRQIVIKFSLLCSSADELLNIRAKINKVFNPKLGIGSLYYSYKGVERIIDCVPDGTPVMPLVSNKKDCIGEVVLLAYNPYLRDINETKVNIAQWKGGFKFPLKLKQPGVIMGRKEPSLIANVFNNGDVNSGMLIEFIARGTVRNPSLFNVNTREYIKLNKIMISGEKITINTNYGQKKIISEIGGVKKDILNYYDLTSTFLQLDVGDNLFRYDAEENLNNLEVSIYYTNKYVGV